MKGSHSSLNDPELFRKIKDSVTMQQVAEQYGFPVDRRGLCLCPFHQDKQPSLKIYPNGKGFYCFSCGAGGDQIKFVSMYHNVSNTDAAKELAADFGIALEEPMTYREKREAELRRKERIKMMAWAKRARLYVKMYWILQCEAIHEHNEHFDEAVHGIEYVRYLVDRLEQDPEELYKDKRAVRQVGEIERRVIGWHGDTGKSGTVPG